MCFANAPKAIQAGKSLKSRIKNIKNILYNKSKINDFIKKIPLINGNDRLKICICDTNVKPCCPQSPPRVELSRQNDLTKKKGSRKTYLDQIVDREKQFRKTSAACSSAKLMPITPSTCPIIEDDSSSVFTGSIECPSDKKRMEYYLWIRPNRKKRTVHCVHSKRRKTEKSHRAVQVNKKG